MEKKRYKIDLIKERKIRKFDIVGYDYKVKIDLVDSTVPFDILVQRLHTVLQGK